MKTDLWNFEFAQQDALPRVYQESEKPSYSPIILLKNLTLESIIILQ